MHKRRFVFGFQSGDPDENRRVRLHGVGNPTRCRRHACQRDTATGFRNRKGFRNRIGCQTHGMADHSGGLWGTVRFHCRRSANTRPCFDIVSPGGIDDDAFRAARFQLAHPILMPQEKAMSLHNLPVRRRSLDRLDKHANS